MVSDPTAITVRTHCHSDFNGPWEPFTLAEREKFLELLHSCADFAEIEIVAFAIHPASFDIVVDTPRQIELSRQEMLTRLEKVTAPAQFELNQRDLRANDPAAWTRLSARFGNVSAFIKQLKQLVTSSYHRGHGSSGTLWNSRFNITYVQAGHTSRILSAWLDHAAVRTGETTCADQDRFSTFGRAVAGDERARAMIAKLFEPEDGSQSWMEIAKTYHTFIQADAVTTRTPRSINGVPRLTRSQLLLTQVPHFRGGLAFGNEAFVENFYQLNSHEFGPRRKRGGHLLAGQNDPNLWTIRQKIDLRRI